MNTLPNLDAKANILVVDDTPQNLELLSTMLKQQEFNVRCAINGSVALKVAQSGWSDIILLDIQMPDINGYEVCKQLKIDQKTLDIPVIFLSALDDIFDKQKAFAAGGVDYISKPFHLQEVLIRIENQLAILAAKQKVSQLNLELEQRVAERTSELQKANQQLKKEIIHRQHFQEQLIHLATRDTLTGLPNRILFMEKLNKILEEAKNNSGRLFSVLFLDCDRFKLINDSLGHFIGDQVLTEMARRIGTYLHSSDCLARFGSDAFTLLLLDKNIHQATQIAQQIQNRLKLPFEVDQHQLFVSVSMGIVAGSKDYEQPEHILRDADTAMYQAKKSCKGCYQVFHADMHSHVLDRLKLETNLRLALEREEFIVYYQPIISLVTNAIVGFEALVRWQHPELGLISPAKFIPVAEETGLIIPLDLLVMSSASHQLRLWQRKYSNQELTISVNLSVKHFSQPDLIENIDRILQETQLDGHNLKLEITESAIMDNPESATVICQKLRQRKIQLSIDDFGTGYSSLSYLHRFPVNTLKIDRSFINRIGQNGENIEIIRAIITIAHHLNIDVVAEGIETEEQRSYLQKLGCEYGQGYLFAKPLSNDAVESILANSWELHYSLNKTPVL